ncbi:hypothetical protein AURDEDRAFT_124608 [Auricularia subglabra TFB-10046 SS5]|nr:hypothetical protein AURDEDRAFT_124608 [Auricularia subglabra TFB-10046 SS5]
MAGSSTVSVEHLYLINILQIPAITVFFYDWGGTNLACSNDRQLRLAGCAIMCDLIRGMGAKNESETMYVLLLPSVSTAHLTPGSRRVSSTVRVFSMIGILILVQVILQIRVYAMYDSSRKILWLNATLFLLEWTATLGLYAVFSRHIHLLVYEAYLCTLAVRKSFSAKSTFEGSGVKGVWGILIKDSVVYFVLLVAISNPHPVLTRPRVASALGLSMIMFFAAPVPGHLRCHRWDSHHSVSSTGRIAGA